LASARPPLATDIAYTFQARYHHQAAREKVCPYDKSIGHLFSLFDGENCNHHLNQLPDIHLSNRLVRAELLRYHRPARYPIALKVFYGCLANGY
jgi:hypothetical protein